MPTIPETKPIPKVRKSIVIGLVVFFISFGLPLYYLTTTVYRAVLPKEQIIDLSDTLLQRTKFDIPVYIQPPGQSVDFISNCQELIQNKLNLLHNDLSDFWNVKLLEIEDSVTSDDYVLKYESNQVKSQNSLNLAAYNRNISINIDSDAHDLAQVTVDMLLEQVFDSEIREVIKIITKEVSEDKKEVALSYSPKFDIVFSLVVEGGRVINWEIDKVINLLQPIIEELQHFSNLSISSQVHYYSKMAIQTELSEDNSMLIINPNDLPSFIDFGNWNLESNSANPTITFMLYFPDANFEDKTLKIENSVTNSFLVPQWGGVHIFNKNVDSEQPVLLTRQDLLPVLEIFTSQLFHLLGLPKTPKSPIYRMDILTRISVYWNLRKSLDNLNSLVKVTESLVEISIPDQTRDYVTKALSQIENSLSELASQNFKRAVEYSAEALVNSEKAFFEKEMVQQAYFPSEHKLAVFLPLLGPMASILCIGFLKIISEWKNKKEKKD